MRDPRRVHHNVGLSPRRWWRCTHESAHGCTGNGHHAPLFSLPECGCARNRRITTWKQATAITAVVTSTATPTGSPEGTGRVCAGHCYPSVDRVAARYELIDESAFTKVRFVFMEYVQVCLARSPSLYLGAATATWDSCTCNFLTPLVVLLYMFQIRPK